MPINLFGWQITRAQPERPSFVSPENEDAAAIVQAPVAGAAYGTYIDIAGSARGEAELVTQYRTMSEDPEVEPAINNIVNEAIVSDEDDPTVKIYLDDIDDLPDPVKDAMEECFDTILRLLEFNTDGYEIFKRWYVDGRLYYHAMIDEKAPQLGLQEIRYIDPRKIKKVKLVKPIPIQGQTGGLMQQTVGEYYAYKDQGFDSKPNPAQTVTTVDTTLKIAVDAIVYVTSGILNERGTMVLSYLNKAIRPLNLLRQEEDAAVIYRLVRAPERRVWYINVGGLPKAAAEQHMHDMMTRYRNRVVYDSASGTIKDDRKHMTMMEDIWVARQGDNQTTSIDTLPPSQNLGQMEEVQYFLKKLYKSLHVPVGRLDPDMMYSLGRATEVTRDEITFQKFIDKLRLRFAELFLDLMEKQLVLTGVMTIDDWKQIRSDVKFRWAQDNIFAELKDNAVQLERISIVTQYLPITGRMVSNEWVRRHLLKQDEDEMKEIDQQILDERMNPIYMTPLDPEGQPMALMPGMSVPGGPPGLPGPGEDPSQDPSQDQQNQQQQQNK